MKKNNKLRQLLVEGIKPHWEKVDADLIDPLVSLLQKTLDHDSRTPAGVARVLVEEVKSVVKTIATLHSGQASFISRHAVMETEEERRENIISYAAELGASSKELKEDRKAFRRFFDQSVMVDRFRNRLGDQQRRLVFLLDRLGVISGKAIVGAGDPVTEWRTLAIECLTSDLIDDEGDSRIAEAAFRCLAETITALPAGLRPPVLDPKTVQTIHRLALDTERGVWIQCEAVSLLYRTSSPSFDAVARTRLLSPPGEGDDFFVRHRLVPLVAKFQGWPTHLCKDPSPFVRQGLADELDKVHPEEFFSTLHALALHDKESSVRAAALLKIPELVKIDGIAPAYLAETVICALRNEKDDYVSRVAIKVGVDGHAALPDSERAEWRAIVLPALREVHLRNKNIAVRRWAAQGRERVWCDSKPQLAEFRDRAAEAVKKIIPGESAFLKDRFAASLDDTTLGRVLSIVAVDDFGLDIKKKRRGISIQRGHKFGLRLWRILHEMKDPSPDKRSGFSHTIGRIFSGSLRIPSAQMSEMSPTKVPGEPLTLKQEGGWRPFVPLVDEVISALDVNSKRKPLRVVTSEGVTELRPPRSPVRRIRAHHALNSRFQRFARLRNSENPNEYIKALRKLGFECEFHPPEGENTEPEVARTFSHGCIPLLAFPGSFDINRLKEYFYSAYDNSIGQLLIFLVGAFSFFIGRHIYLNQRFHRFRKKIPLVVGGWGTRGKSGTERIKAAMFNALGHRIVSKTTGCEAMFLYSPAFGNLHELFLFRPYDKATIWEQVNLVGLASKLKSHVFLWECMALTPGYVKILQGQWMKDDISTIVNTYPDHEDLQGPAGINIPEVMTNFLRSGGHCLTSEQQMTPVLEAAANQMNCRFDKVGWVEPGLLTPDVLARFPYAEHPNNIALVAEMGIRLGIPRVFSLKEMADRVVPDLGVLKVYPESDVSGRRIQLVNGFSANERFATLGNWNRLGFNEQDPETEPGVWISAVVNNRADRIARSWVFAGIIADDIFVDRVFLIGGNLKGMVGYIQEAFEARTKDITLFPGDGNQPGTILGKEMRRLRLPESKEALGKRFGAMSGEGDKSKWEEPYLTNFQEYEAFAKKLNGNADKESIDREFRNLLWQWFSRKLIVISDYHATGDQVIHRIAEETPPGYLNRVMGLQNIKGTGLDFIYRWQAWDRCYKACEKLTDRKLKVAREGLVELASFNDYGLLCEKKVFASIAEAAQLHSLRDPGFKARLDLIEENLKDALKVIQARIAPGAAASSGFFDGIRDCILDTAESLLDGGDAIRRRKKANQIYRDLGNERISPDRVVIEIQKLNRRQKGGWLKKTLCGK